MAETFKSIATWFSGTHEQLVELLSKARSRPAENNLEDYTVAELKTLAKEKGLKGYSSLKKSDLVQFINDNS